MKFLSLCSGIEAASVAFEPLGWEAVAFSEIDPFPCAVPAHHFPDVPNMGDMANFQQWPDNIFLEADIIVGGPPCQAFSVAGLRAGLNDARGNLTLTYFSLINYADEIRQKHGKQPVIALYENVTGILSDKTGAFGCLLAGLAGEDEAIDVKKWPRAGVVDGGRRRVAWCVIDAQYFGVAQRRRRVFVIAVPGEFVERFGNRAHPAEILSIGYCLRGDTPTRGQARQVAPTIPSRSTAGGGLWTDFDCDGGLVTLAHGQGGAEVGFNRCPTLTCNHEAPIAAYSTSGAGYWREGIGALRGRTQDSHENICCVSGDVAHTLKGEGFDASEDGTGRGTLLVVHGTQDPCTDEHLAFALGRNSGQENVVAFSAKDYGGDATDDLSPTLRAMTHSSSHANGGGQVAVAHSIRTANTSSNGWGIQEEVTHTLDCTAGPAVQGAMQVRRLTPVECERLQGFPDGWTAIPWRKKPASECPDGPRYKAIGNSWAVPVVAWIGRRIDAAMREAGSV